MKSIRVLCITLSPVLMALAGCATGPTADQVSRADYGQDMTSGQCVAASEQVIADTLKDPSSAQFRHVACEKGYWQAVPILGMGVKFGWMQKGQVNGKNSYGGYVGFRQYQALIKDGSVVRYCLGDKDGLCMPVDR